MPPLHTLVIDTEEQRGLLYAQTAPSVRDRTVLDRFWGGLFGLSFVAGTVCGGAVGHRTDPQRSVLWQIGEAGLRNACGSFQEPKIPGGHPAPVVRHS